MPSVLPIDAVLPELVARLRESGVVVLKAATGAGKTTRVPPALLDAGLAGTGDVYVLQPRRVAARAAALRVASERGSPPGGEVGWQVRHERRGGRQTRLWFVTEGIFLRKLQDDPFLEGVGAVVFDEFHERTLDADLALALVRRTRREVRPDLRLVVMSATLAVAGLAEFLGDCPVLESPGRTFPVRVEYRPRGPSLAGGAYLAVVPAEVVAATEELLAETTGSVLVFLPGVGEIRQVERALDGTARRLGVRVVPLYGDLPLEEQAAVLADTPDRRIVLATNVAETSLTVPGITGVVDVGLARESLADPATGLNRLELVRISQASAEQRTGRAGRTAPGVCLRLWSEREHRGLAPFALPEIRRTELSQAVLQLHDWGEDDPAGFEWFEAPDPAALTAAESLLERLGALRDGRLAPFGRTLARLPVAPRLGSMLCEGHALGQVAAVALAAALLTERDPFVRGPIGTLRGGAPARISDSDLVDRVEVLSAATGGGFRRGGRQATELGQLDLAAARRIAHSAEQLARDATRILGPEPEPQVEADEAVRRAAWAGYADRLVRARGARGKGRMLGGGGVTLAPQSAVTDAELYVALDLDARRGEALVRLASAVERDWLDPAELRIAVSAEFDPDRERLVGKRRTVWRDLLLDEVPSDLPADFDGGAALAAAAAERLDRVLPADDRDWDRFLSRARFLATARPELNLPVLAPERLAELLPDLCRRKRSFAELRSAPWASWVRNLFTQEQLQSLDREAPERLKLPSGRQVALDYQADGPPILAARIQHLFGLRETPQVAGGRTAVLVHLLAPNGRPQQITQDLPSFWKTTYHEVRKELRRRYPKHAWPEDPWSILPDEA